MKKTILFSTLLGASLFVNAQSVQFEQMDPSATAPFNTGNFVGVQYGDVAFADIDGDGDLDVIVTGYNSGNRIAQLYTNDGSGNYTLVPGTPFTGVFNSAVAFADIDGNGTQDLLITGSDASSNKIAELYTNDGNGNFTLVSGTPFIGVSDGTINFIDVDGDNDLDVFITGSASSKTSILYKNDGNGNFSIYDDANFIKVSAGAVAFADIDGDNDLDLIVSGADSNFDSKTELYINDGAGNFISGGTPFTQVRFSSIAFADVDGDNDQDVIISGSDGSNRKTQLYINDGSGSFSLVAGTPFSNVQGSAVAFSDVNGDGSQDVMISGDDGSNKITELYINDGNGGFTLNTGTTFTGVDNGTIDFVDVDGDNKLEIFITGYSSEEIIKIYKNISCEPVFGTDIQTACISYEWIDGNIYTESNTTATFVYTVDNCDSIVTLNLTINTVNTDVTQTGTTLTSDATGATYKWLDCNNGNEVIAGATNQVFEVTENGSYAVEVTENGCVDTSACFTVTTVGIETYNQSVFKLYPNPVNNILTVVSQEDINQIEVYDITGKLLETINPQSTEITLDFSSYQEGVYLIKVQTTDGKVSSSRIVKK